MNDYRSYDKDDDDDNKETGGKYSKGYSDYQPPSKKLTYKNSKYALNGKSAHNSRVKNYSPKYYASNKYTKIQPALSPYQKYSFQPIGNLKSASFENIQSLPSTAEPYFKPSDAPFAISSTAASIYAEYPQPTDLKFQRASGKNCKKIDKQLSPEDISHGRFRRSADKMNCFVCEDPKTGDNYEQCSYTSDPDDGEYFSGHASKYSTLTQIDPDENSRYKRSPRRKDRRNKRQREEGEQEEAEEYSNPFENEKQKSHSYGSKPEEFDSEYSPEYKSPDFSNYKEDYRFGPEYFTDAANEEKSYSEQQAEELKKHSENCKKVRKDSMVCMVCSNPKTGGNYEQCSYSSEPQEKKYSYVKEKKYNSNEPDGETTEVESTDNKPIVRNKSRKQKPLKKNSSYKVGYEPHRSTANTKRQKKINTENYDGYDVFHPSGTTRVPNKYKGLNPDLYGQPDTYEPDKKGKESQVKEDYVYKLFPEYAEKESEIKEIQRPAFEYKSDLPEYFTAEESKKDVDSVLAEFKKKDRSKCKKVAKDKMTCFLCTDEKGVQHEECMFVSESQPKSSHVAYHEVKEFSSDPNINENKQEASNIRTTEVAPTARTVKQRLPKKTTTPKPVETYVEPSTSSNTKAGRVARRKTNLNKDFLGSTTHKAPIQKREVKPEISEKDIRTDEGLEDIEEVQIENSDGAFASELVPTYSKKYGTTLPKYMLEISEHEKIVDELTYGR